MTTIPGSIPGVKPIGAAKPNTLPGIDCPNPSTHMGAYDDKTKSMRNSRPRKKAKPKQAKFDSRRNEDRDRAELLQAAILMSRGRLGLPQEGSPFDLRGEQANPIRPDNSLALGLEDATISTSQR